MEVLEALENETLESHSRSRGFEYFAIRAHKKERREARFTSQILMDEPSSQHKGCTQSDLIFVSFEIGLILTAVLRIANRMLS